MCVSPMTNISSPDFLASLFKQYGNEASALVVANDALAFYGVILLKGGKVESICGGHPNLPIQHLYDHVLQCLSEDISMEMEK